MQGAEVSRADLANASAFGIPRLFLLRIHLQEGGQGTIPRHSFIRMGKLPDVRGRITYISSHAKQENLYAVYETTDRHYWTELAKCSQQEFQKSGTEGKCIEAREFIIALPESFPDLYEPDKLLQLFTERFKEKYGVECVSALHHNKRKTNYHIHLIFSERRRLPEPIEKTASRNMFYNEQGKHVRTKKEILDENGEIRKGCRIVKKGEVYERNLFTPKDRLFKQDSFVDEVKHFYTDLINALIKDDKEKLHVFDSNGLYLATKKIGKNNPKAEQIQTDNEKRMRWNQEVDRAIVSGVTETEIRQIKQEYITDRMKESFRLFGSKPELFSSIISTAIAALVLLVSKVMKKAVELSEKILHTEPKYASVTPPKETETKAAPEMPQKISEQPPPRPAMPADAAAYPKLHKIYIELSKQNGIIFDAERERNAIEEEINNLKGIAKLTKKKELQGKLDRANERVDLLKKGLSGIVKRYGYQTVHDFYRAYGVSRSAYADYQENDAKWEEAYGMKTPKDTLHDRLQNYQKTIAEEQKKKHSVHSKGRGAR